MPPPTAAPPAPASGAQADPAAPVGAPRRIRRRRSLTARLALASCVLVVAAIAAALALRDWLGDPVMAGAAAAAVVVPLALWAVQRVLVPVTAMFRALAGAVTSYRDGDFAFSLAWPRNDELGDLVTAHNALGDTLRAQRETLVHRELLLDTMVQNTPVAMLLCDPGGHIVFGNVAARQLLSAGRRLEGQRLDALLEAGPEPLRDVVARGHDGLFAVERDGEEEIYHLARNRFRLNGRPHELFVLRHLTSELHRAEVRTWKKVIRVISHELNNSLAPIASLAHSGGELLRRGKHEQLDKVFATIAERSRHLEQFILGYARFAKLPAPRPEPTAWTDLVERLRGQIAFQVDGALPEARGQFDPAQLEQALVNLLRNAHESGSPPAEVQLRIRKLPRGIAIEVSDRGTGMTEAVLSSALLPFYSTKRGGTGLGLALVREITEAHGGRVALANRPGGGVSVTITLPQ
ncbi:MAG TPA: PAS domain-containing sensor histidine kinase [Kofleriaceae bacterium]|nr:PAS domain-containing sensor histidine kinase [Kofleriaceae bacterium]